MIVSRNLLFSLRSVSTSSTKATNESALMHVLTMFELIEPYYIMFVVAMGLLGNTVSLVLLLSNRTK
jgi:hypothetical protein